MRLHFSEYTHDPGAALTHLIAFINEQPTDEGVVRLGDAYSLLIMHNFKRENYKKARLSK